MRLEFGQDVTRNIIERIVHEDETMMKNSLSQWIRKYINYVKS